jgi:hypothetical protein
VVFPRLSVSARSDGGTSTDGGAPSNDAASATDATDSKDASDAGDAGDAGFDPNDQPYSCTPNTAPMGGDPTYVLGGTRPAFQGGIIQPGFYRATKATNYFVEDTAGDCNGKTPPVATTYATEIEIRATHYLLRSAGVTIAGEWTTSNNEWLVTLTCPNTKGAQGFGYSVVGSTIVRDSGKTNYTSGGCHYGLVYEFTKQ